MMLVIADLLLHQKLSLNYLSLHFILHFTTIDQFGFKPQHTMKYVDFYSNRLYHICKQMCLTELITTFGLKNLLITISP